jgi:alanine racemase
VNPVKTFAEIDLKALSHNLEVVKKKTKNKPVLAVVKADAYGHGAIEVSRHLLKNKIARLGVAFVEEAIVLREAGIKAPIIVFFDPHNIDLFFKYNLTPVVYNYKNAKAFSDRAYKYNCKLSVHLKVDTGMGRVGLKTEDALAEILKIAEIKNLHLEGLMSHFSDADLKDRDFSEIQLSRFLRLIKSLKEKKIHFKFFHVANSAAILGFPKSHLDMVRPGIMLYGYGPVKKDILKPVLSLKSRIIFIKKVPAGTPISYGRTFITKRESLIATVPVGYADGYSRRLSNQGEVLINGRRAPVVGRVCMDTIMIDVTEIPQAREDTEVVLIGTQGKEKITAQDIAEKTGTIPYEVLTGISKRVKRIYKC